MTTALIAFEKTLEMFTIFLLGTFLAKIHFIDEHTTKKLSNLLLFVIMPCLAIANYQIPFSRQLMQGWILTVTLGIAQFAMAILFSRLILKKGSEYDTDLERIAMIYCDCGFIGIPLAGGIFGQEGIFYMMAYTTVFNVFLWTQGISLMNGRQPVKTVLQNLCTPALLAIMIGIVLFFTQIRLPQVIGSPIASIAAMNTPLAMLVAGASMEKNNIRSMITNRRLAYVSALVLVALPLLFILTCGFLPLPQQPYAVVLIAAACPAGTSGTLFALRYNRDSGYASEIMAFTTVCSILTIPAILALYEFLTSVL